jgi:hypothetical protein
MNRSGCTEQLITNPSSLPTRPGKRPLTIQGPLHVQCDGHGDDEMLRQLVTRVRAWPGVEAGPLPIGSANLVSLKLRKDYAPDDPTVFIGRREFGRILFGAPTIYLSLPVSAAHWTIIRGWAEPHFSASFGLVPPGVMVLYTPRDESEMAVCLSLFRISYDFALTAGSRDVSERDTPGTSRGWQGRVENGPVGVFRGRDAGSPARSSTFLTRRT